MRITCEEPIWCVDAGCLLAWVHIHVLVHLASRLFRDSEGNWQESTRLLGKNLASVKSPLSCFLYYWTDAKYLVDSHCWFIAPQLWSFCSTRPSAQRLTHRPVISEINWALLTQCLDVPPVFVLTNLKQAHLEGCFFPPHCYCTQDDHKTFVIMYTVL